MNLQENKQAQLRTEPEWILVRRSGALGDVILTTPIIARLRETYPAAAITVATYYREVFNNNPNVTFVVLPDLPDITKFDIVYDLDLVYERSPSTHIVYAYMQHVFGDDGTAEWDLQQKLYLNKPRAQYFAHGKYVAVHPAVAGWANRTLPRDTWVKLCKLLKAQGYQPIVVGSQRDMIELEAPSFWVPDIHAHMQLYQAACCFVGSDSALIHVAGATQVPIVGVFTCVKPQYRLPIRRGQMGWNCMAVMPDLPCVGCQERQPAPTMVESCERGDVACVKSVLAVDIFRAIEQLIG